MSLRGTTSCYGALAATLHWLSAAALLPMLPLGFSAAHSDDATRTATLLRIHIPLGLLILLLIGTRIVWWWFDVRPALPASVPAWQNLLAKVNHVGLYATVLLLCSSGIALVSLSGLAPAIFNGGAVRSSLFEQEPVLRAHLVGVALLLFLLALHLTGALYHLVRRDQPFARMRIANLREDWR